MLRPSPATDPATAFRRIATSNLLAHLAEQVGTGTLMIVAVAVLGAGPGATGAIQALATLPFLILAIPIGTLTDRSSPRTVMIAGECVRVLALLTIATLLVSDHLGIPKLALLGLVGSTGTVAYTVGAPSIVSELVERRSLLRANSTIELTRSLAIASGPALAGAVIGWVGAEPALGIAIGSSALAVTALIRLRVTPRAPSRRSAALADVREGARWTLGHPLMRPVIVTAVLFNTAWFCLQGIFVAYAMQSLGYSATRVGWALSCYGIGMIGGAAVSGYVFARVPVGMAICIGPIAGLLAMLTMSLSIVTAETLAPPIAFGLLGAGPILWTISTTTLRQSLASTDMLGRVSAIIVTATAGARPLGAVLGAIVATWLGVHWAIALCVAGMAAQALVITTSQVARLRDYPESSEAPAPTGAAPMTS